MTIWSVNRRLGVGPTPISRGFSVGPMTIRSGLCRLLIGHVTIRRKTVDSNRESYDVHVGIVTTPTCRADGWPTLHKHTTPDAFMSIRRRRADIVLTTNRYRASVFPMSICYLGSFRFRYFVIHYGASNFYSNPGHWFNRISDVYTKVASRCVARKQWRTQRSSENSVWMPKNIVFCNSANWRSWKNGGRSLNFSRLVIHLLGKP